MNCLIRIVFITLVISFLTKSLYAEEIAVARFASEGMSGWESKSFKGKSVYNIVKDDNRTVLKAHSKGGASGLTKKVSFKPTKYRYLKWSWKIENIIAKGDEKRKEGDDYAARIYVVFPGKFFWQTKALNYIWGNKLPAGEYLPNAYTGNAIMFAVESGAEKTGRWLNEERDIAADYRKAFGEEPPEAAAIAIMTDTDNTGGEATAWYGDITLSTTR